MLTEEIIQRKKTGKALTDADIQAFVRGITDHSVSNEQIAAFAMAVNFQDMSPEETASLTLAMRDSGVTLGWQDLALDGPVVDKHSTGGVGDTVSLLLAPMLAACGCYVPMISGRGLGHTGGTLDKMESIPGYDIAIPLKKLRDVVKTTGMAIIGQSDLLVPADRRFYAVRDTTATIDVLPLIVASILSKKLAEGLDALVMDIKVGNGAFMRNIKQATALADRITRTAKLAGLKCHTQFHDMNQPLADCAGNALEVAHAVSHLTGEITESRLLETTLSLGQELLVMTGLAEAEWDAEIQLLQALQSGQALEHWQRSISALGAPADFSENWQKYLPQARYQIEVRSNKTGRLATVDTRQLGLWLVEMKAGRKKAGDPIDPAVGISDIQPLDTRIAVGDTLCILHLNDRSQSQQLIESVRQCFRVE
jgi:thymidine phosphorylase